MGVTSHPSKTQRYYCFNDSGGVLLHHLIFMCMGISEKSLFKMKKWQLLLHCLSCGEHIFAMQTSNDRDSFKASLIREKRNNKDYDFTFNYTGLNVLVTKTKR